MHCGETAICEFAGVLTLVGIFIPFSFFKKAAPASCGRPFIIDAVARLAETDRGPRVAGGLLQGHLTAYIRQFSQPKLVDMGTLAIRGRTS